MNFEYKYFDIENESFHKYKEIFKSLYDNKLYLDIEGYVLKIMWLHPEHYIPNRVKMTVLYDNNVPIGVCVLNVGEDFGWDTKNCSGFFSIFIDPLYRGKGLAKELAKNFFNRDDMGTVLNTGETSDRLLESIGANHIRADLEEV